MYQLSLVQPVDGFCQRVVVAVTTTTHRWFDASFCQSFGVPNGHIWRATIRTVNQGFVKLWRRSNKACSSASNTKSVRMELLTRQPTIFLTNTSMTNATNSQPCHVDTYVKSDTHNWLGRAALNCRLTLSNGHGAEVSGVMVRMTLPRRTPHKPC